MELAIADTYKDVDRHSVLVGRADFSADPSADPSAEPPADPSQDPFGKAGVGPTQWGPERGAGGG